MQIGLIVAALLEQEGLSLEALAARVRAAGAPNVKYQHIQQLIDIPSRKPRYLPELARAFGMTVEQFLSWKPGAPRLVVSESSSSYGSHPVGLDPEILAASYKLVRLACIALPADFDPEAPGDAHLILLGYDYLSARQQRSVTPDNLVDFTAYLRKQGEEQGDDAKPRARHTRSPRAGTG